ncbi:MAG: helix-turn-helix domain-containing protein [Salibacteraceae bacterium]
MLNEIPGIDRKPPAHRTMNYFVIPGITSPELNRLLYIVSHFTGIPPSRIRSKDQTKEVASARHIFSYVAKMTFGFTYQFIADYLNRSSHSTIKISVQQAIIYMETEGSFRQIVDQVGGALSDFEHRRAS